MTAIGETTSDAVHHPRTVHVTVRTPAGASGEFDFEVDELVISAVNTAVERFVSERKLAAGDYGLALVRGGETTDLTDTNKLEDYGIVDRDVLHLINEKPQVDG